MPNISFQGELGAYSHEACTQACPTYEPLPCPTFEDAVAEEAPAEDAAPEATEETADDAGDAESDETKD